MTSSREEEASVAGRGLHGGRPAKVSVRASPGPVRLRAAGVDAELSRWRVVDSERSTTIEAAGGSVRLQTVEHLLAALAGAGIHRGLTVTVEGGEVPLADGGAARFFDLVHGRVAPSPPRLRITRADEIVVGPSVYRFAPAGRTNEVHVEAHFHSAVPRFDRRAGWSGDAFDFRARIAPARTFAFASEVEAIAAGGLARHVDPESVVVLPDGDGAAPDAPALSGARPAEDDEPARHKLLDLLGDLYLHGGPPLGSLGAERPGHRANHAAIAEALRRGVLVALVAALFVVAFLAPGRALASPYDEPYDLPSAPRPPTLPTLTHPDLEATVESTLGILQPSGSGGASLVYIQRIGVEYPFANRRFFLGANYEAVAGSLPGVDSSGKFVSGNTELFARTVWATRTGLAFGGGGAVMLPSATFGSSGAAFNTVTAAAAVRPWDNAFFDANAFTFRPFVDARAFDHGFLVQFRQTLDISQSVISAAPRTELAAVASVFVGYQIGEHLGAGVEAFELYVIKGAADDGARSTIALSPSLRILTPVVQPAISGIFDIHDSLAPTVGGAYGVRVALTFVLTPSGRKTKVDDEAPPEGL